MKLLSNLSSTTAIQCLPKFLRLIALIPLLILFGVAQAADKIQPLEFSQAELDQLLAPIALYPDTVLSQVLIAATYPIEIIQADRWASNNKSAKGADAVKLVENKDWDPSVKALVAFPDILQRMSEDVDWTQKLGDAFLSNEARVMDTIQNLRKKAYASGSLEKVQHLKVQRTEQEIVIEPAEERVVYVPVYDTRVVYGNWWWADYPPVYWHYPSSYTYVSGFYWGPSIYIGPRFFYSSCHWRNRHVVVIDRHNDYYRHNNFYTTNSIVTYEGARAWRHEPIHRRGVAYYNNELRDNYGSRHESYRDARTYREGRGQEYRGRPLESLGTNSPTRQNRFGDGRTRGDGNMTHPRTLSTNGINFGANESPRTSIDRSEQVRERLSRSDDTNTQDSQGSARIIRNGNLNSRENSTQNRPLSETEQQVSRTLERESANQRFRHEDINRNSDRSHDEQTGRSRAIREAENRESIISRIPQESRQATERIQVLPRDDSATNNRIMRTDNSMNRRIESPRIESGNMENPRHTNERSDDGNRGNRGNRAN
jgi:hypothetical protein